MPDLAGHSLPSPPDDSAKATIPPLADEQEGVDFSAAVAHENHAATPLRSQEPPYILLVTDDLGFGQQVTAALVRLGYRTAMIQTADPAAAISRSAAERPDMVMLNIDALSLGGIGLSRRLKADTPGLRVLTLVHGHELAAAREEASISGADVVYGLLDLPLQLEEIVRDLLAQRAVASDSEKAPAEPPRSLQARIKSEARAFDFSALLDGVGTDRSRLATPDVELPAPVPEEDEHPWLAEPEIRRSGGPSMKSQRAPRSLKSAVFALVAIAAVAAPIYLLNSGALPTSEVNATTPPPGKPNIDLTVRKGMPFPPLTPGERKDMPRPPVPIPQDAQDKVFAAYGLSPLHAQQYVVVRLIPAELGGTEDPWNLFPTTPWFADLKKRLDKKLVDLVSEGKLTREQAEVELKDNWIKATHRYYIRNYGLDAEEARIKENSIKW